MIIFMGREDDRAGRFPHERHRRMCAFVKERGRASVEELMRHFAVSGPTVRRDLAVLAQAGLLVRTHGGVAAAERAHGVEPLFMEKLRRQQAAKQRIARAASRMAQEGQSVLVDSGTTGLALARVLAGRRLDLVLLDVKAAEAAASGDTRARVIGGEVRNGYFNIVGQSVLDALGTLSFDVFFLAADAIDPQGVSNVTEEEALIKRAAIGRAARTVLIADHTKLDQRAPAPVCGWEAIDLFITDRGAGAAIAPYEALARGIELH